MTSLSIVSADVMAGNVLAVHRTLPTLAK